MTLTFYGKFTRLHMQKIVTGKYTQMGKTFRKWASGQKIYEFEKEINPRCYYDPALGLYACI